LGYFIGTGVKHKRNRAKEIRPVIFLFLSRGIVSFKVGGWAKFITKAKTAQNSHPIQKKPRGIRAKTVYLATFF